MRVTGGQSSRFARGSCLVLALALGLALVPVAVVPAAGQADVVPQTGEVDPDGVVLRVDVDENGTAAWTVEYRIRLDDEATTAAFESLRSDVRENRSSFRSRFADRMSRTVATAENETGRSMALRNVSVAVAERQLPRTYGVVAYRFEWAGFARVDGDRLVVGDAIGGIFLDDESRLVVGWPASYEATSVAPGGYDDRDSAAAWAGPVDFGPSEPRVVVQPATATGGGPPVLGLLAIVVALGLGGGAGYLYRRRGRGTARNAEGGAAVAGSENESESDRAEGGAGGPSEPPEELLSPEERVLRFVREEGGRVKQQAVVTEFDWTAARTSQVVGSLRDDERVETFRLGRENVITLPEVGVEGEAGDDEDDEDDEGDRDLDPAA